MCILCEDTEGFKEEGDMALTSPNYHTGPGIPLEHLVVMPVEARAAQITSRKRQAFRLAPGTSLLQVEGLVLF